MKNCSPFRAKDHEGEEDTVIGITYFTACMKAP